MEEWPSSALRMHTRLESSVDWSLYIIVKKKKMDRHVAYAYVTLSSEHSWVQQRQLQRESDSVYANIQVPWTVQENVKDRRGSHRKSQLAVSAESIVRAKLLPKLHLDNVAVPVPIT